jgi:SecD/SecF fusion protein
MKPVTNLTLGIILFVTALSIYLTVPTARYYMHLRHEPESEKPRPLAQSPRPPEIEAEKLGKWEKDNPEVYEWRLRNPDYIKWEETKNHLRERAIPLGLDLRGGVDLTVGLDEQKTIAKEVVNLRENLQRSFDEQKLSVQFMETGDATRLKLRVADPADAQTVANLVNSAFDYAIDRSLSVEELQQGGVTFGLSTEATAEKLEGDLAGAMQVIKDRLDGLGVTQPRVALQGDRIRAVVPGEEDPQRIIENVLKVADLEFHMVVENYQQYLGPDGRVAETTILPPGTAKYPAKLAIDPDPVTRKVRHQEGDVVLYREAVLTGADLRSAGKYFNPNDLRNPIQVSLEFKSDGAQRFAELTTTYADAVPERQFAILLEGVARSVPAINEPILEGRAVIRGGFSDEEATELSQILKAGALPAPLKIMSLRTVGATLGAQSIMSGVRALVWGALIVAIFMLVYYRAAGLIAIIALILNVLIILSSMALFKATLTLSGIGGILLTVGMAVDANVLIYERIREEIGLGKPLRQAISTGFNRAFTVILDSNMTTLMTALVLLQFTEGSVFGFALTMSFGLLANLFTGLTVTYALCYLWFTRRGDLSLGSLSVLRNTNFDFIGRRKISMGLSTILLIGAMAAVTGRGGLQYSVDFEGGLSADVVFTQPVDESQLRQAISGSALGGGSVTQVVNRTNTFVIDVPLVAPRQGAEGDPDLTRQTLNDVLEATYPGGFEIQGAQVFGSQVGSEFAELALVVVILASIAILIYLWFRFELVFGIAAVIALIHDLSIVLLLATLWGVEVSLDEVAALMVLLGFSVNDTIVIFDRIRENARNVYGKSFKEQCNLAMNQSLSRTVVTSGTVLFAALMLLVFGGPSLASFAKIITLGTIVGTYSSDFLATPLVYMWNEYKGDKLRQQLAEKRKRKVEAARPVRGGAIR